MNDINLNLHEIKYILNLAPEERNGYQWLKLMQYDEKYIAECPWKKLDINHWYYVLKAHPELADKCDKQDEFTEFD